MPSANSPIAIWNSFTPHERSRIAIYIAGIMFYKFGLEMWNGAVVTYATLLFDRNAARDGVAANTFQNIGVMTGLYQAAQCVGAILIAPLIKRFPIRTVLSVAVLTFGVLAAILLIVDAATGGTFKPAGASGNSASYFGNPKVGGVIGVYAITGIAYGMVELIRRVIPRDIVGGDVVKLRRMDATVHILYEVAGTAGAFASASIILSVGANRVFIITPCCYAAAAATWYFLGPLNFKRAALEHLDQPRSIGARIASYPKAILNGARLFFLSIIRGASLVFGSRKMIWLFAAYALALYGHRYLENAIAPAFARRALGVAAYSQIMVGGSNFGELLGALFVFIFSELVKTPIPWLRLDAFMLMLIWYLPFYYPARGDVAAAWRIAGLFAGISFGWAAGDVSLAAYIQASLARDEKEDDEVSNLGAVMSFLYSSYIILFAVLGSQLGRYIDNVTNTVASGGQGRPVQDAIYNVGGVQFTVLAGIVLLATFIPRGSWAINPSLLENRDLSGSIETDSEKGIDKDSFDSPHQYDGNTGEILRAPIYEKQPAAALANPPIKA